jgi:hypothetical protein
MVFYTLLSADIWELFDTKIDTHTTYTKKLKYFTMKICFERPPFLATKCGC